MQRSPYSKNEETQVKDYIGPGRLVSAPVHLVRSDPDVHPRYTLQDRRQKAGYREEGNVLGAMESTHTLDRRSTVVSRAGDGLHPLNDVDLRHCTKEDAKDDR